jgi:general secretion pathway protein A
MFSLWQAAFSEGGEDACEQALRQGLECLGENGTPALLKALDRPAMLDLVAGDTRQPAILTALDGDSATLWMAGRMHTVPVSQFLAAWPGDFVVLWKPPSLDTRALSPGHRGPAVTELRSRLARWQGRGIPSREPDSFDGGLQSAVRELQRQHGLKDDGIAGARTQAVLDAALAAPDSPRLSKPRMEAP